MTLHHIHTIDPDAAADAVRELAKALNRGRASEASEPKQRLEDLGLAVSPQQGRSLAAREAAAAERDRGSGFHKSPSSVDSAPSKSEPQAASTPLAARKSPRAEGR